LATPLSHSPLALEAREEQQRIVLDVLAAAVGEPVPYSRLRDAGVEFPAAVVAELALAALPVRRCPTTTGSRSRGPAVRLCEPVVMEEAEPPPAVALRLLGRPARRSRRRAALLAAAGSVACAVIALALTGSLASGGHRRLIREASVSQPRRTGEASARSRSHQTVARRPVAAQPSAASLQLYGHDLLAAVRYAQAAAVLRQAIGATRMSVATCAQPAGKTCLVYAYSLYDLGRALLLAGEPRAAAAMLEVRLRIANQLPVVAAELALARAAVTRG
jgi:hypothetical protein